jgi:gamma-glutamyltranspeptidase / glutathione hydrolase
MKWQVSVVFFACALGTLGDRCFAGGAEEPVRAQHAMVVSAHQLATEAGVAVLKSGGNAVDAAVATGFALAVVYPKAGNLGGGGFMLIRMNDGAVIFLDYRERAPAGAFPEMFQDADGNVISEASRVGFRAVAVPGSVKGLVHAQRRYGSLNLKRVMAPAIRLAQQGFVLSAPEARSMTNDKGLARFDDSRRIFQNNGKGWHEGDAFRQPELARTLERIRDNPDSFYKGRIARELAAFIQRGGGLISEQDLAAYQVIEREPVRGNYRDLQIISAPPPSSGGIAIIQTLNMLEHFNLAAAGSNSADAIHLTVEAYRRAFLDRAQFLGDPDSSLIPVQRLVEKPYAADWSRTIDRHRASASLSLVRPDSLPELNRYAAQHPVLRTAKESTETTHYSIVDAQGNAVAVTTTINGSYGSRVTAGSLGFLLNNEMDDFTAKAGAANMFGLVQGKANEVAPGKRPLSAMSPTLVLRENKLWLVLGSPGGPAIITTVVNMIVNVADFGMDIQQAVNAPRFHHQWLPDRIVMERRIPADITAQLKDRGHEIAFGSGNTDGECIQIDLRTNERLGASDIRNETAKAIGF